MEHDRNIELFMAAFYADLNSLQTLIIKKTDMQLRISLPDGSYKWYWDNPYVEVNVLDILNWGVYGLYQYYDEDLLCHNMYNAENIQILNECINPSMYYYKAIECIDWLCDKFDIINYQLKDYSRYRTLRHFMDEDENWLDEDEVKEALGKGFREIDLNLINEAEKGNGASCYSLVKKGACYKIDPADYTEDSLILEILGSDRSFHTLGTISYLSDRTKWSETDAYDMLSGLYQVGVSNYILDIVMMNES